MTVPWDVARLRSQEKVSGAELLNATKESQPMAGTRPANEAAAAHGGPRGRPGGMVGMNLCVEFVGALQGMTCSLGESRVLICFFLIKRFW